MNPLLFLVYGKGDLVSQRVLVIEDNEDTLQLIEEALQKSGYETATATSAQEGFNKIREFNPHLVLTDNDMPGLTGLELLRDLRSQLNYVAVIFVSGRRDVEFVNQALRSGADDFIRKPFAFDEMLARIDSCLRTRELHTQLMSANHKLQEMVDRDHLTGLFNMRSMYERIDGELKRAERHKRQLACIMLDMDFFKSVNDKNDHLFGSFVLKEMGQLIMETMRASDFAARYGGDEFLVVLTETDVTGAKIFCERLRKCVEDHTFIDGASSTRLTISLGCAVTKIGSTVDARRLVREADHALYRAKEAGRNRVEEVEV